MSHPKEIGGKVNNLDAKPLLGVLATANNLDDIERICVRALANDWNVLVGCPEDTVPELPDVTDVAGITVYPLPSDSQEQGESVLETVVDELSPPRFHFVEDSSTPVAFERRDIPSDAREFVPDARPSETHQLVAIPAYNEEETVGQVAGAASDYADEVVVIDDGSSDKTIREAWRAEVDVVSHTQNRGYGATLQTAFDIAAERDAETLVILDGDGQHDPADIPKLAENVEDASANVAIGSRFVGESSGNIPLYRRFGLLVINTLTNLSLGNFSEDCWIHDTQSGYRAYDRDAIETLSSVDRIGDGMGASLDILYQVTESGLTVEESHVVVEYDVPSGNSQNPVSHGIGLLVTILQTTVRRYTVSPLKISTLLLAIFLTIAYLAFAGFVPFDPVTALPISVSGLP